MEGKLCRYHEEVVEVAEVKDDDDPTSELSYETVYHTPVAIAGLLEDVPHWLVPIGNLEVTPGGFEEDIRDGDEGSDQELESVALQVREGSGGGRKRHAGGVCFSCPFCHELTSAFQIQTEEESSDGTDIEHFMHPVGPVCLRLTAESKLTDRRIPIQSQMVIASRLIPSRPAPSFVSVATQTVVRTYADASVEAVNVRCMPWGEFRQLIWETVQENAMTRVLALLQEM